MLDMYDTVEKAQEQLETAFNDYGDEDRDSIAFDLICSIAGLCTREVAAEFCRRELGYVPAMMNLIHPGLSREMED